ncbi:hypothetical protein DDE18_02560 [Nocardioides gansuensis]|uniref:Thiamine-binding protein domain-containing protein n=1 Tax=Nocardioides gansuensis TaxID=2138300 RepID=A0A2T8FFN6_9ACTN|nr:thiamine-binding protein [Nocardioides gansuensis]PVG84505.1 hypothetical protein DDE18_02560 [Nocardioides gansuensis]
MRLVAEFTTEPFHGEGEPPAHALAALHAAEHADLDVEFGPLGTTVRGEGDQVVHALADVLRAALSHGASRVTLQVEPADVDDDPDDDEPDD